MKQMTLAAAKGFEKHNRATRKAGFLERVLRMCGIAHGFNLSDEACEDALCDVPVFREFCRIDLGRERGSDGRRYVDRGTALGQKQREEARS